jgi:hypothetical protein
MGKPLLPIFLCPNQSQRTTLAPRNANVPILIVTKRLFVNVDGCIVEHANKGIRPLAALQNKQAIKFTANELTLSRRK